jgi:DNA-binding NarL/FixJ family response regulator
MLQHNLDGASFRLPVWAVGKPDTMRCGPAPDGGDEASREATGLRVVVVEDEPFVRLDIELALQNAGHHVVGAADNADRAVELAGLQRPDVMIMDVRLQGMRDGIDAAIEIWQRFGIRSVFASATLDASLRARAAAANPIGFVDKPFMSSTLVAALPTKV